MFVLKPAHIDDLDQLLALADVMAPGITTFPPNKAVIREKIAKSQAAFALSIDDVSTPRDFLLVLHDTSTSRVIGTTAIYSHIGAEYPFYSFKRVTEVHMTQLPDRDEVIKVESTSLQLVHDFHGGTEVGTLLLHPDYKGYGLGKMLAKSRYLFIRIFQQLFNEPVFAELRGWTEEGDKSPFWDAVGQHFFAGIEFSHADYLSAVTNKQFIADLMPKYPIYEDLLPLQARECINKAHTKGQAALSMLYKEGFRDEGYIDIFDAGATVVAKFTDLDTFNNSHQYRVSNNSSMPGIPDKKALIATDSLASFRVLLADCYSTKQHNITLPNENTDILRCKADDSVWVFKLN